MKTNPLLAQDQIDPQAQDKQAPLPDVMPLGAPQLSGQPPVTGDPAAPPAPVVGNAGPQVGAPSLPPVAPSPVQAPTQGSGLPTVVPLPAAPNQVSPTAPGAGVQTTTAQPMSPTAPGAGILTKTAPEPLSPTAPGVVPVTQQPAVLKAATPFTAATAQPDQTQRDTEQFAAYQANKDQNSGTTMFRNLYHRDPGPADQAELTRLAGMITTGNDNSQGAQLFNNFDKAVASGGVTGDQAGMSNFLAANSEGLLGDKTPQPQAGAGVTTRTPEQMQQEADLGQIQSIQRTNGGVALLNDSGDPARDAYLRKLAEDNGIPYQTTQTGAVVNPKGAPVAGNPGGFTTQTGEAWNGRTDAGGNSPAPTPPAPTNGPIPPALPLGGPTDAGNSVPSSAPAPTGGATADPKKLADLLAGLPSANAQGTGIGQQSTFGPGKDLITSQITPDAFAPASDYTAARTTASNALSKVADAPDRAKLALDAYNLLEQGGQEQFNRDQAQAVKNGVKYGRLGSGMLEQNLNDVFYNRQKNLDLLKKSLASEAAGQTLSDRQNVLRSALDTTGSLQGFDLNNANQNAQNRNELRTERGYQYGQSQDALNNRITQTELGDRLQNSQLQRLLSQLGFANNLNGADPLESLIAAQGLGGIDNGSANTAAMIQLLTQLGQKNGQN